MSGPHWAKGQGLERGLRTLPGWWIFGAYLWHWSHFLTYFYASFRIFGHQYPCVRARHDRDLPPVWLPQMPSCNSSRIDSTVSRGTQSRYGPEKDRLYNFLSSDNQYRGALLRIFSASTLSSGNMSLSRNFNMGSIQFGDKLVWLIWQTSFSGEVGVHKSSTIITRGKFRTEEVARVAKESA